MRPGAAARTFTPVPILEPNMHPATSLRQPPHAHAPTRLSAAVATLATLTFLATLGVPVVTGFPFGHTLTRNAALPFASQVRLDADNAALYLLEPVAV